jgi:acetyl-CoA C-acetyltransferase
MGNHNTTDTVILSATRTPVGAFMGGLKDLPAPKLGAAVVKEAVQRAGIQPGEIDEVLMGCVLTAGIGQAPARQASRFAGLPDSVRCTTINRVCGSGLRAVMWGSQILQTGDANFVVAGGMESMSRVPYLLDRAREGYRLGHGKVVDAIISDGLWDVYNDYHMGDAAELCARERHLDRKEQDRYATQSYQRAIESIQGGKFKNEITAVEWDTPREKKRVDQDEEPFRAKLEKFGDLKPAFQKEGTVTAANASSLSDGAAALVLTTGQIATDRTLKPIARIIGQANHAQAPEWFTTAPVGAVQKLLKRTGISLDAIDLFEINEAFSVVALACLKELKIDESKINIRGGAVAIGHPIGASGARILTTLVHALRMEKKRYGIAAICIGGGEASAVLVEALG